MRKIVQISFLSISIFFLLAFFLSPNDVLASEGTIKLISTTQENYRCFASSLQMLNQVYKVTFSCRELIYPVDSNIFNYILWAQPVGEGNPIKLGSLGLGKGQFEVKSAFSGLFVTTESNARVNKPQGRVVMRGNVEPISFLQEPTTPTLTPTKTEVQSEQPTQPTLTTRQKLLLALKRAGIAALLTLITLIGLVFVVTRSRG